MRNFFVTLTAWPVLVDSNQFIGLYGAADPSELSGPPAPDLNQAEASIAGISGARSIVVKALVQTATDGASIH